MQERRFTGKIINRTRLILITALIAAAISITDQALSADESPAGKSDAIAENEPIQITANQLISNNEEKYAEFIENVKAIQGDIVITSDKLRIYYKGDPLNSEAQGNDEEMLKKIIATGHVKIKTEQYYAESDRVEYDTASMTMVLIGEGSKVISGKNSITGSRITLYRKDGRFKVEGSEKKRIKAVFYSNDKTSDAFKIEKPKE